MLRPLGSLLPLTLAAAAAGAVAGSLAVTTPAQAQQTVRKISWMCPLGYVDTLNGQCSTLGLARYTVRPTNGQPCPSGWMNVGGGYCRRK